MEQPLRRSHLFRQTIRRKMRIAPPAVFDSLLREKERGTENNRTCVCLTRKPSAHFFAYDVPLFLPPLSLSFVGVLVSDVCGWGGSLSLVVIHFATRMAWTFSHKITLRSVLFLT